MKPGLFRHRTICSIEGDDGTDAGGADTSGEDATNGATTGSSGVDVDAVAAAVANSVLSQVQQLIAPIQERVEALPTTDSVNAAIRRATKGKGNSGSTTKPETTAAPSSKGEGTSDLQRQLEEMQTKFAFSEAIQGVALTPEQRADLMESFQAVRPDDPAAWVAAKVKTRGYGTSSSPEPKTEPEAPATPAATAAPTPTPKPAVSNGGSPAAPVTNIDEIRNPADYTPDVIARMYSKYGPRKANKMIRETAERWGKTVEVRPGAR